MLKCACRALPMFWVCSVIRIYKQPKRVERIGQRQSNQSLWGSVATLKIRKTWMIILLKQKGGGPIAKSIRGTMPTPLVAGHGSSDWSGWATLLRTLRIHICWTYQDCFSFLAFWNVQEGVRSCPPRGWSGGCRDGSRYVEGDSKILILQYVP